MESLPLTSPLWTYSFRIFKNEANPILDICPCVVYSHLKVNFFPQKKHSDVFHVACPDADMSDSRHTVWLYNKLKNFSLQPSNVLVTTYVECRSV